MMPLYPQGSQVIRALIDMGIVPSECRRFELIADADEPVLFRYEIRPSAEQMQILLDTLQQHPEELSRVAKKLIAFRGEAKITADISE